MKISKEPSQDEDLYNLILKINKRENDIYDFKHDNAGFDNKKLEKE